MLNQDSSIQINNVEKVFNLALLSAIRSNIWQRIKEAGHLIESKEVYSIIEQFQYEGKKFQFNTKLEERQQKSYRLLSLIRTGKMMDFYDILMKLYMSENRPIPDILITLLNKEDSIDFSAKAYAFLSGFLSKNNYQKQ